nr:MAG TPA: hypothetical protein [Bacteriophage sp.]
MFLFFLCLKLWDNWTESYIPVNKGRCKQPAGHYYGKRKY